MLYAKTTPEQKRRDLRTMLTPGAARQFPGTFTPLSAPLIQQKGFDGLYVSGAVLANELGLPDTGMTTLTEVTQRAGQIARVS
ncbi:MAG: methylisocitrate lyase, partial [Nesterenkonia sp.]